MLMDETHAKSVQDIKHLPLEKDVELFVAKDPRHDITAANAQGLLDPLYGLVQSMARLVRECQVWHMVYERRLCYSMLPILCYSPPLRR
jgi:hypothetical protein